jgi:hypothetical protein
MIKSLALTALLAGSASAWSASPMTMKVGKFFVQISAWCRGPFEDDKFFWERKVKNKNKSQLFLLEHQKYCGYEYFLAAGVLAAN